MRATALEQSSIQGRSETLLEGNRDRVTALLLSD